MSDVIPAPRPRATLPPMPSLPAYLRGPALVALCAAGACLACAAAAWAQAPDLAPALPAGPAAGADPGLGALAPLLDGAGSAGLFAVAVIGIVRDWRREWREESSRHAAERERLREDVAALRRELDHHRLETTHRLERAGDAVAAVRASMESR